MPKLSMKAVVSAACVDLKLNGTAYTVTVGRSFHVLERCPSKLIVSAQDNTSSDADLGDDVLLSVIQGDCIAVFNFLVEDGRVIVRVPPSHKVYFDADTDAHDGKLSLGPIGEEDGEESVTASPAYAFVKVGEQYETATTLDSLDAILHPLSHTTTEVQVRQD